MKLEVSLAFVWAIRHISTAALTDISSADNEVQSPSFSSVGVGAQQPLFDHWNPSITGSSTSSNNYNRRNWSEKKNGKYKGGRVPRGKAATLEPILNLRSASTIAPTVVSSMQDTKGMMSHKKSKNTNPSLPTQADNKHSLRASKSKDGKSDKNVFGMKSKTAKTFSKGKGYSYDDEDDEEKSLAPTQEPPGHYYAMNYYPMKYSMTSSRSTKYLVKKKMDSENGMSRMKRLTKSHIDRSSSKSKNWAGSMDESGTQAPSSTIHRTQAPTEDEAMTIPTQTPMEPAESEAPITPNNFTASPVDAMIPTQAPATLTPANSTEGPFETTLTPSQAPATPLSNTTPEPVTSSNSTTAPTLTPATPSNSTQSPSGSTAGPTAGPTSLPSASPTAGPTSPPSNGPTAGPTAGPTSLPSASPTAAPTSPPSDGPTAGPTAGPTSPPSSGPTAGPTNGTVPINSTQAPSMVPITLTPGNSTQSPTVTSTRAPLIIPINSTQSPTNAVGTLTQSPTAAPTTNSTQEPATQINSTQSPITLNSNTIDFEGCVQDLVTADVNGNEAINIIEYLTFVQEYGKRKCYATDELTVEQNSAFTLLACLCRFEIGADPDCCRANNANLSIKGAAAMLLDPQNRTQEQADFLISICSLTDAGIDSECVPISS